MKNEKLKRIKGFCSYCNEEKYLTPIGRMCDDCLERAWNAFEVAKDEGRI